ncbi:hypothetical protein HRM2_26200 [Desulforapulum autotrophicum HRM2]|uniref:Uncharacterized protein n=1 Tax=Desulforapulum autotrophicum (strain ATCC 43914 / DSM 3382 / VKM B-1955 / HRM2) TaxID=177437 RepID=C0QH65_DESAH|nr:hypothetical protein HRM2_26200 [Desulforapulum autotrophicum HRM2]
MVHGKIRFIILVNIVMDYFLDKLERMRIKTRFLSRKI